MVGRALLMAPEQYQSVYASPRPGRAPEDDAENDDNDEGRDVGGNGETRDRQIG